MIPITTHAATTDRHRAINGNRAHKTVANPSAIRAVITNNPNAMLTIAPAIRITALIRTIALALSMETDAPTRISAVRSGAIMVTETSEMGRGIQRVVPNGEISFNHMGHVPSLGHAAITIIAECLNVMKLKRGVMADHHAATLRTSVSVTIMSVRKITLNEINILHASTSAMIALEMVHGNMILVLSRMHGSAMNAHHADQSGQALDVITRL